MHVPKTGGTSIKYSLLDVDGSEKKGVHVNGIRGKEIAGEHWNNYFKFAFVRNPFSRVVSWYLHLKREIRLGLKGHKINDPGTFDNFVKNYCEIYKHKKLESFYIFQNQLDFLNDGTDVNINKIGTFENLQDDYAYICDIIEIDKVRLSHHKKWGDPDYQKYYNDELKQIMYKRFEKDFDYFGYRF